MGHQRAEDLHLRAQYATHIFLITRTDPTLPKHKGLTMFLVPTSSPGIERQPLPTIGDETTNITYYSDIRLLRPVPHRGGQQRLVRPARPAGRRAPLGGHASKLEDVSGGVCHMRYLSQSVEAAVRWAKDAPDGDGPMIDDKAFLAGIGHMLVEMEAGACTPAAMGRVKGSDVARLGCEELIDLVGPAATLPYGAEGAIGDGAIEFAHRRPSTPRPPAAPSRCSAPSSPSTTWACRGRTTPAARCSCSKAAPPRRRPNLTA